MGPASLTLHLRLSSSRCGSRLRIVDSTAHAAQPLKYSHLCHRSTSTTPTENILASQDYSGSPPIPLTDFTPEHVLFGNHTLQGAFPLFQPNPTLSPRYHMRAYCVSDASATESSCACWIFLTSASNMVPPPPPTRSEPEPEVEEVFSALTSSN